MDFGWLLVRFGWPPASLVGRAGMEFCRYMRKGE